MQNLLLLWFYLLLKFERFMLAMANNMNNVHWEVQTRPIVFGESVKLYCNTSSVQDKCQQCQQIWYGGTNQEMLSFNGFPVNHSKYETTEDSDGFALIIKHFDQGDLEWYSCAYGFYYDNKELQLLNDFENNNKDEKSRPSTTEVLERSLPSTTEIVKHSIPLTTKIMDQYLPSTTEIVQQSRLSITEIVGIVCGVAVLIVITSVLIVVFVHVSKRKIYEQIKIVSLQQA